MNRPRLNDLLRLSLMLVTVAAAASGCTASRWWEECGELTWPPMRFQVVLFSEEQVHKGHSTRSSVSFAAFEGGGISLYLSSFQPHSVPNHPVQCRQLSQREFDRWTQTVEALIFHLSERGNQQHEFIYVVGADGYSKGQAAIAYLDAEGLAVVQGLVCLALGTFGEPGETALNAAGPVLLDGFEEVATCLSPEVDSRH